ncbi:MAG: hypothetical protein S4CHLAM81_13870 [Chlamydiales bacterium]|nr:hypothetical protein [Chlamydiales bacterium]MCH9636159.1 hypothetical protein [Chlamydiales bacterium]
MSTHTSVQKWKNANWTNAADYHFYTWDAPFLDYTKEGKGHGIDRKRMMGFQAKQPDIFRCKKYTQVVRTISLPAIKFHSSHEIEQLSAEDRIKYLLVCIFGKIGEKPCHWIDNPLMRRTSPSGGSRHPSEGYFTPSSTLNMHKGLYHIQADPASLYQISKVFDRSLVIPSSNNLSSSDCLGTIIISSVFERNMYRYREPRTFRTIHMDAGHLIASIEILSNELGMIAIPHLRFDESKILDAIGASKLEEGIMALITLRKEVAV